MKIHSKVILYVSLFTIGIVSFLAATYLPITETAKTITALPFVGALFTVLFQLLRDHSSFVNESKIQEQEHLFLVAATSHMSKVVFDKHVSFSEEYISELIVLLEKLFAEGPSKKSSSYVQPLRGIRRKYMLWISPNIAEKLEKFEDKILKLGSKWGLAEKHLDGNHFDEAHNLFLEILELREKNDKDPEIETKANQGYLIVVQHLQDILGIVKLTELRDSVIYNSNSNN